MKEDKLKQLTERHQGEIQKLIEDAYNSGFNDGLGITLPTTEEFNEYHKDVRDYGEEAEWLVLSFADHTEEQAVRKFKKYCKEQFGHDEEEANNIADTIRMTWIGYKVGPHESEPTYWLSMHEAPAFWQAWVVETQ